MNRHEDLRGFFTNLATKLAPSSNRDITNLLKILRNFSSFPSSLLIIGFNLAEKLNEYVEKGEIALQGSSIPVTLSMSLFTDVAKLCVLIFCFEISLQIAILKIITTL